MQVVKITVILISIIIIVTTLLNKSAIGLLSGIGAYNNERQVCPGDLINGRHLTNIGTFRMYLAILPECDLKIYQEPSGWDLQQLAERQLD